MKALTPGAVYLLRNIPYLLAPSCVVFAGLSYLSASDDYDYGSLSMRSLSLVARIGVSIMAGALSLPALLWLSIAYLRYNARFRAARHGARLPPVVNEGWGVIGEMKVLQGLARRHKSGNPGMSSIFMNNWPERYGNTFIVRPLFSGFIFTTEPEIVKAVLATEFDSFEKGKVFTDTMSSVLGTGVFNSDGDMWKFHRALTRPFFTRARISDFETFDRNGIHG